MRIGKLKLWKLIVVVGLCAIVLAGCSTFEDIFGGGGDDETAVDISLTSPTNGAENQETSLTLTWSGNGTTYDVYLDKNNPPTTKVKNDNSTKSYEISGLDGGTKYYWQVEATKDGTSEKSGVWSFTTKSVDSEKAEGTITITYPTSSTVWTLGGGNTYAEWTGATDSVLFEIYAGGLYKGVYHITTANDGHVDGSAALDDWGTGNEFQLKIIDKNGNFGWSEKFSITEAISKTGLVAYYPFDGDAKDASGNGHHGTEHGNTISYVAGQKEKAVKFDNTQSTSIFHKNDYLSLPKTSFKDFTISLWVKFDENNHGGHNAALYAAGDASRDPHFKMMVSVDGKLHISINKDGADIMKDESPKVDFSDKQWHHIVASKSSQSVLFFEDGKLLKKLGLKEDLEIENLEHWIAYHEWYGGTASASRFTGQIDEVRIYNKALTEAEISELYKKDGGGEATGAATNIANQSTITYSSISTSAYGGYTPKASDVVDGEVKGLNFWTASSFSGSGWLNFAFSSSKSVAGIVIFSGHIHGSTSYRIKYKVEIKSNNEWKEVSTSQWIDNSISGVSKYYISDNHSANMHTIQLNTETALDEVRVSIDDSNYPGSYLWRTPIYEVKILTEGYEEWRVRYILADISLGGPLSYYKGYPNNKNAVESVKRWESGVRPTNSDKFERRLVNGSTTITYKGTDNMINGMDVKLTTD